MVKTMKNWLVATASFVLLLLIVCQPVTAVPPIPMTVEGVAIIDGEVAHEGTVVTALMDGEPVYEDSVSSDGKFELLIPGDTGDSGREVTFTINGEATPKSFTWETQKQVFSLELSNGISDDDTKNSGSKSDSDSSENVIRGNTINEPAVIIEEKNLEEASDNPQVDLSETELSTEDSTESSIGAAQPEQFTEEASGDSLDNSSEKSPAGSAKSQSVPGFGMGCAVMGLILLYAVYRQKEV